MLDSSSGWACTASRRNGSASVTRSLSPAGTTVRRKGAPRSGGGGARHLVFHYRSGTPAPCWSPAHPRAPVLGWPDTSGRSPDGGRPPTFSRSNAVSTPTDEQNQGVWLTQEAHDRLKAELDQLVAGRPAMAAEINARREEGDLKENGGYHAAKDEQGKQEARIRQLTDLLRKARVGDAPKTATNAALGTVISIRFAGDDDVEKFLLGSREIAGTTDLTVYSPESAMGAAIMGAAPGTTVTYQAPNGRDISVEVVAVEPFVP
nr:transcription elongation factor GreA [Geodermatophilus sabuli]